MSYTSIFFLSQSEKKLTVSKKVFLEIDYFNLEYRLLIFFFAFTQSKHIDYFFFLSLNDAIFSLTVCILTCAR